MLRSAISHLFALTLALLTLSSASVLADASLHIPSARSLGNPLHARSRWTPPRVARRQAAPPTNRELMQVDLDIWAAETTQKCISALSNITAASNPAGIVVCYNLPFLDPETGVFAADLRMYQVSARQDEWQGVNDISMSLEYQAAAVERTNLNTTETVVPEGPAMVKQFNFLGQIKPEFLRQGMTSQELRALLVPAVSLSARTAGGTDLTTALAMNEAAFVNGVFSELADNNVPVVVQAPPFKLPGTRIEIVPAGLYLVTAYTIIGVGVFMWGTFERRQYRDQYRKRLAKS